MVLRVVCWYGILVIAGKAIIILLAFMLLIPDEAIYSTSLVQVMYPVIPLTVVLYWTRGIFKPSNRTLATGIVGGAALAVLFTYLGLLVTILFYPFM
jgi:hypothetical protein